MLHVGDIVTIDRQPNIPLGESGRVTIPDVYLGSPRLITAIDAVDGVHKYKFSSVMEEQPYWLKEDLTYINTSTHPQFNIGDRVVAKDIYSVYVGSSDMIPASFSIEPDTPMTVVGIQKRWIECKYILKPDKYSDVCRVYDQHTGEPALLWTGETNLTAVGDYTLF